ncbi:MAG: hypothetical protein ACKOCT_09940 [Alphaproteobacteria bacterium]
MSGPDLDDEVGEQSGETATAPGAIAYVGTVVRWNPDSGSGTVRTASGRELDFDVEHASVLGALVAGPRAFAISTGQAIGYDVGWTSRGLRVTKLFPAG